ncbi:sugar transferase [Micromonospora haikouensis]|uniref:sugar transferase n=1 Tax=Micromonospora haikouensis TaxID=686309 RepID=UPI0033EDFE75
MKARSPRCLVLGRIDMTDGTALSRPYERIKRVFDVTVTALVLILAAPMMAVTALAIALTMGRPILFRQHRPGLHGELFEMIKFRSMRAGGDPLSPAHDADRLTPLGRWLRATSLDELPSLWNVLRGDMSLVGPRPLLPQYLQRYTPEQFRRHDVRPGVTGLQQARGRNALTWEERFAYDLWYIEHRSLLLDLRILTWTAIAVLRRDGITAPGSATAHEYQGVALPDRAREAVR